MAGVRYSRVDGGTGILDISGSCDPDKLEIYHEGLITISDAFNSAKLYMFECPSNRMHVEWRTPIDRLEASPVYPFGVQWMGYRIMDRSFYHPIYADYVTSVVEEFYLYLWKLHLDSNDELANMLSGYGTYVSSVSPTVVAPPIPKIIGRIVEGHHSLFYPRPRVCPACKHLTAIMQTLEDADHCYACGTGWEIDDDRDSTDL